YNTAIWWMSDKKKYEPGEQAKIYLSTFQENTVLYEVEQSQTELQRQWLQLNDTKQTLQFPIVESHRGNVSIHFTFLKNNRLYHKRTTLTVPYTNKELSIEFMSFRNKLLPGQEEEWRLKLRGPKGEKVAAEMLATLYDASLDTFRTNRFNFSIYPRYYARNRWSLGSESGSIYYRIRENHWNTTAKRAYIQYDRLNWFGLSLYNGRGYYGRNFSRAQRYSDSAVADEDEAEVTTGAPSPKPAGAVRSKRDAKKKSKRRDSSVNFNGSQGKPSVSKSKEKSLVGVKARTNFQETAFFYPHLQTDKDGNIIVKFTIPEALTRWKMLGLAHTKDLKYGMASNELITQKELMVVPNAPRFFREGDTIFFATKISNVSAKDLQGIAKLQLFNAINRKPLQISTPKNLRNFVVKKGESSALEWKLQIPDGVQAITYRILAKAGNVSDGEEKAIPVLTNRMLVTESLPLHHRGKGARVFLHKKLINNTSKTLRHHKLTLEYTSNPAWYAIQALPYIMEYPYECAEQLFSRFYANSLATHIVNSSPKIKRVFDAWKTGSPGNKKALLSNLEKNQELKALLLEETPWVVDAQDESERKKRIALLFDFNRMANELRRALFKLQKMQVSSGGFPWFAGMPEDRYITQHIVTGIGHLKHLGIKNVLGNQDVKKIMQKAVRYLDSKLLEDYEQLVMLEKRDGIDLAKQHIGHFHIQYLYARSFFIKELPIATRVKEAFAYYKWQAKTYWNQFLQHKMTIGMIALSLHRLGETTPEKVQKKLQTHGLKDFAVANVPKKIIKSLNEHALHSEEMGMYWKADSGFYWYQLPIETQSLLIEVYSEVAGNKKAVNELRTWLLKQKQTTDWKTTKATADAIYSLLLKGDDWLATEPQLKITLGNKTIDPIRNKEIQTEAGTGYFKVSYNAKEIENSMGKVTLIPMVQNKLLPPSWGSLYWQYFEQLDKITPHKTPLHLKKQLFLQKDSPTGPVLTPVVAGTKLQTGDLIKVRIELRSDRDMEYIHMKDMRASGFEPVNVLSRYKWQDGLGYYESTRDAATNFFISYLPKGTYVFEYPLRVSHNGNFSNGVTTIQSMYAPEFTSHSEGIRVQVKR
ncbi:MAG: alpha-2-macroglobulin family protein, partial [Spirochaetota bacterium]